MDHGYAPVEASYNPVGCRSVDTCPGPKPEPFCEWSLSNRATGSSRIDKHVSRSHYRKIFIRRNGHSFHQVPLLRKLCSVSVLFRRFASAGPLNMHLNELGSCKRCSNDAGRTEYSFLPNPILVISRGESPESWGKNGMTRHSFNLTTLYLIRNSCWKTRMPSVPSRPSPSRTTSTNDGIHLDGRTLSSSWKRIPPMVKVGWVRTIP